MTGVTIFLHSVRMLARNFESALKVSLPVIIMMVIAGLVVGQDFFVAEFEPSQPVMVSGPEMLLTLLLGIASLWTIVAWHRFVLLEEYPSSLPAFHGDRMLVYFGKSILISLVMIIPMAGLGLVIGLLGQVLPILSIFAVLLIIPAVVWMFYRLSPLLAAAAVGQPMKLTEAWVATSSISGAVVVAAVLTFFVGIALQLIGGLIFAIIPFVGIAGLVLANVATTLVFASLITTIYGVTVEKRTL